MYQIDFHKPLHIHFIGIGGISMSGLAEILLERGFTVTGSDAHESELTDKLTAHGAKIVYGQRAENITDDIDAVVYTAAVHPDNLEYAAAAAKKIPTGGNMPLREGISRAVCSISGSGAFTGISGADGFGVSGSGGREGAGSGWTA